MRGLAAALIVLLCLFAPVRTASAQGPQAAVATLASGDVEAVERAIAGLAASGTSTARAILEALRDGRLLARQGDPTVYLRAADGRILRAVDGEPAEIAASTLRPVRINNRIRRALEGALGALSLRDPDRSQRLAAAEALLVRPEPAALGLLEAALAAEADPAVRTALSRARASILLEHGATSPERTLAARQLAEEPSPLVLSKLKAARAALAEGTGSELAAALDEAIARVEGRLRLLGWVQTLFHGLSLGSVLLLAAVGLAVTFGVMGVINMAHGEMVMLGAYATWAVQQAFRALRPDLLDGSLLVALPAAFLTAALTGLLIERAVISRLYDRPLETLLATFGLSLIVQQAVRLGIGATNREVVTPSWMSGLVEVVPGLALTLNRLVIIGFALALFLLLLLVMRGTRLGLEIRAVTQNRRMAETMGIRTPRIDAMTFALGSGIAGLAGVALAQIDNVSPNLGQAYIVDSFIIVVFGGVGNLWGTLVGALSLGIVNKILEPVAGAVLGKILVLVALILFIQKRPQGIFALRGRAGEA